MTISILFDGTSPQTEKKAAMFLVPGWGDAKGSRAQDLDFEIGFSSSEGAETLRDSGQRSSISVSGYGICRNGSRHSSTGEDGLRQLPETNPLGKWIPATSLDQSR